MVKNKSSNSDHPNMSKAQKRRAAAAAQQAEAQATAVAAAKTAAARRLRLLVGLSIVATVAAVPISMLIGRAVGEDTQDEIVHYAMAATTVIATGLLAFAVGKSHLSQIRPDGFGFQVGFGSFIVAGCGTFTASLAFVFIPLIPAAGLWLIDVSEKRRVSRRKEGG